jgi:type II secretory pathway pseudopilin PulG
MKKSEYGFSALEVLIAIIVIGLIGGAGWYVWDKQYGKQNQITTNNGLVSQDSISNTASDKTASVLSLADGTVTFTTPQNWSKDGIGCIKDSNKYSSTEYLDSVALLPGEKLRTIYGDGTEYFHINVCVFGNNKILTPEKWFTDASVGGIGEGTGSSDDQSSSDSINGYAAYYRKTISSANYHEVNYVISSKDKLVYVQARTYDIDDKLPGVGDFRKFEASLKDMVQSVVIR